MFLNTFLNLLDIHSDALPAASIPEIPTLFISNPTNTQNFHTFTGKKKFFSFDISLEYATTTANFYAVILKHFGTDNEKIFLRMSMIKNAKYKSKKRLEDIVISCAYLEQHGFLLEILNEFMCPNFEIVDPATINVSIYRAVDYSMKPTNTLIEDTICDFKNLLGISENLDSSDVVFQVAIQTSDSDTENTKQFVHSDKFQILFNENSVSVQ